MGISVLRLLSPRGIDFQSTGRGGVPDITPSVVAAALANGLGSYPVNLALYLYTGDSKARAVLEYGVRQAIICEGSTMDPVVLDGLVRSAMGELFDHTRCSTCNGSGMVYSVPLKTGETHGAVVSCTKQRRVLTTCLKCEGHGVGKWSDFKRAKAAGLNGRSYSRRYSAARSAGLRAVRAWQCDLTSHLEAELKEVDD